MRPVRLVLLVLSLLAVGACTSASAGWTYTPAPPATPVPSTVPSAAPSAAPSGGGSAAPSGSAGPSAGAASVTITALAIAFTTPAVTVPAGTAFTLEFDNQDAAIPHDVQIKDGAGAQVFKTDTFPGVEKRSFEVPALTAGTYPFVCTVHSNMTGTLTAQ
jgi:plastocyanin